MLYIYVWIRSILNLYKLLENKFNPTFSLFPPNPIRPRDFILTRRSCGAFEPATVLKTYTVVCAVTRVCPPPRARRCSSNPEHGRCGSLCLCLASRFQLNSSAFPPALIIYSHRCPGTRSTFSAISANLPHFVARCDNTCVVISSPAA